MTPDHCPKKISHSHPRDDPYSKLNFDLRPQEDFVIFVLIFIQIDQKKSSVANLAERGDVLADLGQLPRRHL